MLKLLSEVNENSPINCGGSKILFLGGFDWFVAVVGSELHLKKYDPLDLLELEDTVPSIHDSVVDTGVEPFCQPFLFEVSTTQLGILYQKRLSVSERGLMFIVWDTFTNTKQISLQLSTTRGTDFQYDAFVSSSRVSIIHNRSTSSLNRQEIVISQVTLNTWVLQVLPLDQSSDISGVRGLAIATDAAGTPKCVVYATHDSGQLTPTSKVRPISKLKRANIVSVNQPPSPPTIVVTSDSSNDSVGFIDDLTTLNVGNNNIVIFSTILYKTIGNQTQSFGCLYYLWNSTTPQPFEFSSGESFYQPQLAKIGDEFCLFYASGTSSAVSRALFILKFPDLTSTVPTAEGSTYRKINRGDVLAFSLSPSAPITFKYQGIVLQRENNKIFAYYMAQEVNPQAVIEIEPPSLLNQARETDVEFTLKYSELDFDGLQLTWSTSHASSIKFLNTTPHSVRVRFGRNVPNELQIVTLHYEDVSGVLGTIDIPIRMVQKPAPEFEPRIVSTPWNTPVELQIDPVPPNTEILWSQVSGTPVDILPNSPQVGHAIVKPWDTNPLGEVLKLQVSVNDWVNLPVVKSFNLTVGAFHYFYLGDGSLTVKRYGHGLIASNSGMGYHDLVQTSFYTKFQRAKCRYVADMSSYVYLVVNLTSVLVTRSPFASNQHSYYVAYSEVVDADVTENNLVVLLTKDRLMIFEGDLLDAVDPDSLLYTEDGYITPNYYD